LAYQIINSGQIKSIRAGSARKSILIPASAIENFWRLPTITKAVKDNDRRHKVYFYREKYPFELKQYRQWVCGDMKHGWQSNKNPISN